MHHLLRPVRTLVTTAAVLALAACGADPAAPGTAVSAAPSAALAPADTSSAPVVLATIQASPNGMWNGVKMPLVRGLQIPCSRTGLEIAVFQGEEHLMYRETVLRNGRYQLDMQTNGQGVTGVGLVSGDTYHMSGMSSSKVDFAPGSLVEFEQKNAFTVTSAGKTGNIVATETLHYTMDPFTGGITVTLAKFNAECK